MSNELQELMKNNSEWYKDLLYRDVKVYIRDNINSASRSFVAIGYYLKYVRDNQLYIEDGYNTIWEFAQGEFSIGKSSASRFMAINDRFSKDGNSPILLEQYKNFSSSKLSEMLTMSDEQLDRVNITTTVAEIREIKNPVMDEVVATSQQEPECFIRNDLADGVMCSGGISEECNDCDKYELVEPESITIDDLDLSVRTYNCLKRAGIDTIDELCELTRDDVISIRNISQKCLDEINEKLSEVGRGLKQNHQLPRCTHEADTECNMINIKPIAESLGMDCNGKCCWGCKELCGARCNASAHRPEATGIVSIEPEENRIPDPDLSCKFDPDARCVVASKESCKRNNDDGCMYSSGWDEEDYIIAELDVELDPIETVEADIVQMEPEEVKQGTSYSLNSVYMLLQKAKSDYTEAVRVSGAPEKLVEKRLIIQDALLDYYQELRGRDTGWYQKPQPELPILKNNDQRKEFIDAYETWPIWIDTEPTGERYYRYDLSDKVAMVVKVSLRHIRGYGIQETDEISYGAEQYYLLGIKNEWTSKGTITVEDSSRTFYECSTNKSALVEYLKDYQKK